MVENTQSAPDMSLSSRASEVYRNLLSDHTNAWVTILPKVSPDGEPYKAIIALKVGQENEAVMIRINQTGKEDEEIVGRLEFRRFQESGNPVCLLIFSPKFSSRSEEVEIRRWEF